MNRWIKGERDVAKKQSCAFEETQKGAVTLRSSKAGRQERGDKGIE